ncbi:MAG: 4Fe-4S dicluster domain-containing protein [Desulfobacterales bacterium]|nr:4Fe-4S dicluster domain-containing protein [Desulfobacterales bacterium]
MDFYSFVEGPLLWIAFLAFLAGLLIRLSFFACSIIRSSRNKDKRQVYTVATFGRFFLPFHKAVLKKPFYTALRYIFHICLFAVPIWLSGHISLWSESRFEWEWTALPDAWADWMTLVFLALATYFLLRRLFLTHIRQDSSILDIILIIITALPFMTGYFLTHGTLDSIAFLGDNMGIVHMLSGEAMILMALFLFCRTRLNIQRCIGCASCVQNCPTETLESSDKGKLRVFTYSHFQCICCGSCVNVCPEDAAELRHAISSKRLFQVFSKQEIRSVELEACERCGALFAPEPQMEKIGLTFAHDYIKFCPNCRKANIGDMLHQLSPWHRSPKKADETILKTAPKGGVEDSGFRSAE